jgi:hypothetical protein
VQPATPGVVPPPPTFNEADSLALLDRLTDPARATTASAKQAIALYRRLVPALSTPRTRAAAGYYAGRGFVRLGRDAEACAVFRTSLDDAAGSSMAEALRAQLEGCPAR